MKLTLRFQPFSQGSVAQRAWIFPLHAEANIHVLSCIALMVFATKSKHGTMFGIEMVESLL